MVYLIYYYSFMYYLCLLTKLKDNNVNVMYWNKYPQTKQSVGLIVMWKIVFLYHLWCPSEWVPLSHDPINPLRGPSAQTQKRTNVFFIPFWCDWKLEYHFHPWKCFSSVFQGLGSNLKEKPKKVHLQSDPDETKNTSKPKRHLHSENVPHWHSEVSGSNSKMGNISKNALYIILMKLKPKGHITAKMVVTSTIKQICHWCLGVLGSNSMDNVSKDPPLQISIILKPRTFCLFITVIFFLKFDP